MDYIEGKSLNEIIKKEGCLSEQKALKYIRQIAEALRYVHDKNRLHLDVNPGNIMIDSNDNAILIDFGASKQYDEEDGENTSTLIGKTPGYAPIEQMGNDVVKFFPSTDIYALGATLYKAITGITPPSSNLLAAGEEIDFSIASMSQSTRQAINKARELKKNDRPQTIDEFISIIDNETEINFNIDEKTLLVVADEENDSTDDDNNSHNENKGMRQFVLIGLFNVLMLILMLIFSELIPWIRVGTKTEASAVEYSCSADSDFMVVMNG